MVCLITFAMVNLLLPLCGNTSCLTVRINEDIIKLPLIGILPDSDSFLPINGRGNMSLLGYVHISFIISIVRIAPLTHSWLCNQASS